MLCCVMRDWCAIGVVCVVLRRMRACVVESGGYFLLEVEVEVENERSELGGGHKWDEPQAEHKREPMTCERVTLGLACE